MTIRSLLFNFSVIQPSTIGWYGVFFLVTTFLLSTDIRKNIYARNSYEMYSASHFSPFVMMLQRSRNKFKCRLLLDGRHVEHHTKWNRIYEKFGREDQGWIWKLKAQSNFWIHLRGCIFYELIIGQLLKCIDHRCTNFIIVVYIV